MTATTPTYPSTRVQAFWTTTPPEDADVRFDDEVDLGVPLSEVPGLQSSRDGKAQVVIILDIDNCWHGVYVDTREDQVATLGQAIEALTIARDTLQRLNAAA